MNPTTKKALIYFGIFTGVLITLIVILNLVFRRPNHHNQAKWGTVHIHLSSEFSQHQQAQANLILPELNRLGPRFVLGNGNNLIRIVKVNLADSSGQCLNHGVARYVTNSLGESRIEIDTTCTRGDLEFRTALMHEIGHALGMQHICLPGIKNIDCSPVGRGFAVMNPNITYDDQTQINPHEPYTGAIPTFQIQSLDILEFERVARPGFLVNRSTP